MRSVDNCMIARKFSCHCTAPSQHLTHWWLHVTLMTWHTYNDIHAGTRDWKAQNEFCMSSGAHYTKYSCGQSRDMTGPQSTEHARSKPSWQWPHWTLQQIYCTAHCGTVHYCTVYCGTKAAKWPSCTGQETLPRHNTNRPHIVIDKHTA